MLEITQTTPCCEARLTGELTIQQARTLLEEIQPLLHRGQDLVLNLAQVTKLDSSALQILLVARRHLKSSGKTLTLAAHSEPVLNAMKLTGLTGRFNDPVIESAHRTQ